MIPGNFQRFKDALANRNRWHNNDEFCKAILAVQFKYGLGINICLAGSGLHLDTELHIVRVLGQGQPVPLLDSVHVLRDRRLVDMQRVHNAQITEQVGFH